MKRTSKALLSAVAALTVTAMVVPAAAAKERPQFREGEVIVKFSAGTRLAGMSATALAVNSQAAVAGTMAAVGRPNVALVRFPVGTPVASIVSRFRAQRGVEYAEPNYLAYIPEIDMVASQEQAPRRGVRARDMRSTANPSEAANPIQAAQIDRATSNNFSYNNDTYAGSQDGWSWLGADVIWPDAVANPMIAVLDTGVDYSHPDLAGRVTKGTDWINNDNDPMDDNGHGTHVAGIAGALVNNGKGVAGVSKSMIYAVKVLNAEGSGSYYDIAQGIMQAANNASVKIINMSLGGPCGSSTLKTAVEYATFSKGKLVVVAMGNADADITGHTVCPASFADPAYSVAGPWTMAVGAAGARNYYSPPFSYIDYSCKASYSNYADWMTTIAPGTQIFSTVPYNKEFWLGTYGGVPTSTSYAYLSGTSMASPMVAGAAARTFSAMPAGTTAQQVKTRLTETGTEDILNGQGFFIDTDGNGTDETECWPTATGFNTSTTAAFVAASMNRAEADGVALNANGALGLTGGKVVALSGAAVKGYGGTVDLYGGGYYRILNIPMNDATPYDFAVNKAGFTAGNQKFTQYFIDDCGGGLATPFCVYNFNEQISVGQNTAGRYNLVTDWGWESREVDQYLFGPSASATSNCSVGYSGSCGSGALIASPYMKWLHDGGPFAGSGAVEFSQAILKPLGGGTPYEIFNTDYCIDGLCGSNMYDYGATFRLWSGGVLKATVRADVGSDVATHNCTLGGGTVNCSAWYVGDLTNSGVFTPRNVFGVLATPGSDPDGVLPYARRPSERTNGGTRGLPPPSKGKRARALPE
jgi:thermitase